MPNHEQSDEPPSFIARIKKIFARKSDSSLRETIEEYIDEPSEHGIPEDPAAEHEKLLLSNILRLRNLSVDHVMIPRADIQAVELNTSQKDLLALFAEKQVSRLPVYRETLDEIVGTIHIKDILELLSTGKKVRIADLLTDVPILSPSMPVLDLLRLMRQSRRHMAMVVDEFGGIDGLVTIGDVIEAIVGEIDDEHDTEIEPEIIEETAGRFIADARVELETFEAQFGQILTEEERHENDTLGGLVFYMAGRIPARGEALRHSSGLEFEILDASPRRVNRLRIRRRA